MQQQTDSRKLFRNKYRISSSRLQNWDYGWNAPYFITICTKNRECFFGHIIEENMYLSESGILANQFWYEIPDHFPFIELGEFVVMPNHIHGILIIDKKETGNENINTDVETRHCIISTQLDLKQNPSLDKSLIETIGQKRFQNQGKDTISSIIGSYKSAVTKKARIINPGFGWQSRFHDHIIRDEESFKRISEYIINNPSNWKKDKFYKQ